MNVEKQGCHVYSSNEYPVLVLLVKELVEYPQLKIKIESVLKIWMFNVYLPLVVIAKFRVYKNNYLFSNNNSTIFLLNKQKNNFYTLEQLAIKNICNGYCSSQIQAEIMMQIRQTHKQALN